MTTRRSWEDGFNEYLINLKCDLMYQKGAKKKEEGTDGKGGGNQLPREGGDPIQGHLASLSQLFWKPSTDPNKLSLSPSLAQFPQIS